MELYQNEYDKLKTLIGGQNGKNGWIHNNNRELEATFGSGGHVSQTQFLAVAQRLKAKGYVAEPPIDYMTITIKDQDNDISIRRDTLKNNTRFTITGPTAIEEYCSNESLGNLDYEVILKTSIGNPSDDNLVLDDFEMKFKVRREEERAKEEGIVQRILDNWENEKKAFRLIRRWTFKGDGCRFDLSMVRSNKRNQTGAYIFTELFSDPSQNILAQPPTYEVEVELLHKDETNTVDKAIAKLIKGVGEVLRGIQRSSVLIRKPMKEKVINGYKALVESDKFRGVKPRTLEMKNFISRRLPGTPNIRDGYNVTDKADGLRVLGYCNANGELFMIDKALNVYRTGLMNQACANSLVDGEWITNIKDSENPEKQKATQQLWLFDIYIAPNKVVVDKLPFYSQLAEKESRYQKLREWYANWIKDGPQYTVKGLQAGSRLIVNLKQFEFAIKDDVQIFQKAAAILTRKTEYNTDGLIFTSNSVGLPEADSNFREQFKWKPAEDNTIDFFVRIEKDPDNPLKDLIRSEVRTDTNELVNFKTLTLKVGSSVDPACANPRDTILFKRPIPKGGCKGDRFYRNTSGKYKAVAFNPSEYADPLASVCKIRIEVDPDTGMDYIITDKTKEPIQDKSIVEMRYDMKQPEGWRWIPVRVRTDKTEKLERGELGGTLNADFTAEAVWNSIHNPITRGMISTGSEAPLKDELDEDADSSAIIDLSKPYFERKANKQQLDSVEGLRNFHKHVIKGETLLKPTLKGGEKYVLDLAVGEAADINRWITNNVGFVYGIDVAAKGILDSNRGAYSKYLNRISENNALPETQQIPIAPMVFGIGDASKNLQTGEAAFNNDDANILRALFGKIQPSGPIPPFVQEQIVDGKAPLSDGADVIACMFALHYFFESESKFKNFLDNIKQNLRVGGYFVACFFDGEKVFKLLQNKKVGEYVSGTDRNFALWRITKEYSETVLPTDDTGFGLAIKNKFISIGTEHTEYLVPYPLLVKKMAEAGCLPVMPEDLKELGLPTSSETFDETYKRNPANAEKYQMKLKAVQEYSFLNRWCIFKRYTEGIANEEEAATMRVVSKAITIVNEQQKQASELPTPSLAWREVSEAKSGLPTSAKPPVPKATSTKKKANANLTVLQQGDPSVQSLGTAMADIDARTVALELPVEYPKEKVFYFAAQEQDTNEIKDEDGNVLYPDAARYLAPYTPFTIIDKEGNKEVAYPSILHYISGMMYKKASNNKEWAEDIFSTGGSIHRNMLEEKLKLDGQYENKESPQYKDKLQKLLLDEMNQIANKMPVIMKKTYSTLDFKEATWLGMKDDILRGAYQIRYDKDAKLREILALLCEKEKYLLYRPTPKVTTDLGGISQSKRNQKGILKIVGENKLGKLLMQIAKFPGCDKKIESTEGKEEEE